MWTVLGSLTLWCGELQQASTAGQMSILDGTLLFLIGKEKETHHFVVLQTAHPLLFLGPPPCPLYMEDDKMQGGRVGPGQGAVQSGSLPCSWSGQQSPL